MFYEFSEKELKELKGYIKDYKNEFRDVISVPGNIKFGCEVEFNTKNKMPHYIERLDRNYQVWLDKSDTDIIEVISPILRNNKEDWKLFKDTLSKIDGATIKSTVGGHIHYDASIVRDCNIVYMLKLWNVFEEVIYDFGTGEFDIIRPFAEYYAEKLDELREVISEYEENPQSLDPFYYVQKDYGLNLENHIDRYNFDSDYMNTYEVRVPNGSLDITIWQNNVEFFARFFKFVNNKRNHELINSLYKLGPMNKDFRNRLFLADLIYDDEESKIRFLNQFELCKKFPDVDYKNLIRY